MAGLDAYLAVVGDGNTVALFCNPQKKTAFFAKVVANKYLCKIEIIANRMKKFVQQIDSYIEILKTRCSWVLENL